MPTPSKKALGEILPGFWIGRMAAVRAIFERQTNDQEEWSVVSLMASETMIRTITETLQEEQTAFQQKNGRKLVKHHVVWDMPDKPNAPFVSSKLAEIVEFIGTSLDDSTDRPKRHCLVHCARGVSRSAAVCAAFLISAKGHSLQSAMELVQQARDVNPNLGFLAGLRAIQKCGGDIVKAEQRLMRKIQKQNGSNDSAPPPQELASPAEAKNKTPDTTKKPPTTTDKENAKANSPRNSASDAAEAKEDNAASKPKTSPPEIKVPEEGQYSDEVSC